jgi:hypothetical protein
MGRIGCLNILIREPERGQFCLAEGSREGLCSMDLMMFCDTSFALRNPKLDLIYNKSKVRISSIARRLLVLVRLH